MDDFVLLDKFREKLKQTHCEIPSHIKTLIEEFIKTPEKSLVLVRSKTKTRKKMPQKTDRNLTRKIKRKKNHCTRKRRLKKINGNHTRKIKCSPKL